MRFDSVRGVAVITLCSVLTFSNGALAAVVMLRAGGADAPNVLFEIDRSKKPKENYFEDRTGGRGWIRARSVY